MIRFTKACIAAVCLAGAMTVPMAHADPEIEAAAQVFVEQSVSQWLGNPLIISAIKAQNATHSGLSQSEIDAMDQQWRKETDGAGGSLIEGAVNNELSGFLRGVKDDSQGMVTEVFVMDNKGLNVGQSDVTSDLWQGDEAKWQKTYPEAPNTVFVDDVELDESTQSFQTQISVAIPDPDTGENIGVVTIGVDAEGLLMQ